MLLIFLLNSCLYCRDTEHLPQKVANDQSVDLEADHHNTDRHNAEGQDLLLDHVKDQEAITEEQDHVQEVFHQLKEQRQDNKGVAPILHHSKAVIQVDGIRIQTQQKQMKESQGMKKEEMIKTKK